MITDLDKQNADRSAPTPNKHDQLAHEAVMAKGTNSVNYITPATNDSLVSAAKNGQFTIIQTGNYTTTFSFSSSNPGAGNYGSASYLLYQAPHGLPITPAITGYAQSSSGVFYPLPATNFTSNGSNQAGWYTFNAEVDATNVSIVVSVISYGASVTFAAGFIFNWYLLYQTAT